MVVNIAIFVWALKDGKSLEEAQGMVFMTLILIQFVKAFNYRSDRLSLFKIGILGNKWLVGAVIVFFCHDVTYTIFAGPARSVPHLSAASGRLGNSGIIGRYHFPCPGNSETRDPTVEVNSIAGKLSTSIPYRRTP